MPSVTVERARGRWRDILPLLGVDPRFLVNRHGPCPLCGGRDRYRFDDRDGSGSYYCNQCGAGDGVVLLRKLHNWSFREAADAVDEVIGKTPPPKVEQHRQDDGRTRNAEYAQRIMAEATDPRVVVDYLASRGLSTFPDCLLGHPALAYSHDGAFYGRKPAIVAPITDPTGDLVGLHRIWADRDLPTRKKLAPKFGNLAGAACRLFEVEAVAGIAEGVETAVACYELFAIPTWATIFADGLKKFEPPDGVKTVVIFADNDVSYTGQASAFAAAKRLGCDFEVEVHIPPAAGSDWLDVLNRRAER